MGGQRGDPTSVSTSIALLQERFRQLEKRREKREERELLRLFSESKPTKPAMSFEPARVVDFQNDAIFMSRPTHQDSLSLGLDIYGKHADFRSMKSPPSAKLWSSGETSTVSSSYTYEKPEVDTSLHL